MNNHPDAETLSSYIDEQVGVGEREKIDLHVSACTVCRADLDVLRRAASAVAHLDKVAMTADEHRALRQRLLSERLVIRRSTPLWGALGAAAVVVAAAIGYVNFRGGGPDLDNIGVDAGRPATDSVSFDFETDEQIRQIVTAQAEVSKGMTRFTVADVGTQQEASIRQALSSRSSVAASKSLRQSSPTESTSTSTAAAASFDDSAGEACLRKVLRSQPYPMIPLLASPAAYKQRPAWLLVYAFTAENNSTSRLDRAQIWLISPEDCSRLEGAGLINAAYHYSFYKKP